MYAINVDLYEAGTAPKNLNLKKEKETVGEWTEEVKFMSLDEIPNDLMCFSMEHWLTIVKPKLKEGSQAYHDAND